MLHGNDTTVGWVAVGLPVTVHVSAGSGQDIAKGPHVGARCRGRQTSTFAHSGTPSVQTRRFRHACEAPGIRLSTRRYPGRAYPEVRVDRSVAESPKVAPNALSEDVRISLLGTLSGQPANGNGLPFTPSGCSNTLDGRAEWGLSMFKQHFANCARRGPIPPVSSLKLAYSPPWKGHHGPSASWVRMTGPSLVMATVFS